MNINLHLVGFVAALLFLIAPIVLTILHIRKQVGVKRMSVETAILIFLGSSSLILTTEVEPHLPLTEVFTVLIYGGYVLTWLAAIHGVRFIYRKITGQ